MLLLNNDTTFVSPVIFVTVFLFSYLYSYKLN